MNADSSWSEVRWQEPQSSPSTHDPTTMATRTLLTGNHSSTTDRRREDQRVRLTGPYRRIDHGFRANLHIPAPERRSDKIPPLAASRHFSDHRSNPPYGQRDTSITSPLGDVDETRTGSISDQADQSRRVSELQPTFDARNPNDIPSLCPSNQVSPPPQATLLPSFTSFQESADRDYRQRLTSDAAAKSEDYTCRGCVEKKTFIDDIALAITSLDELINRDGSGPTKRRAEPPQDCSLRTARWVLDCVQDARVTLQGFTVPRPLDYDSQQQASHMEAAMGGSISPSGPNKRGPDDTESAESQFVKRQRTASYNDNYLERTHVAGNLEEQRRASDSLQKGEPFRTFSPAHSDSWTSSAHPQQQSPGFYGRSLRPLPSPSSLAAVSQKASWSAPSAPQGSSPTSIYQAPSSIHTAPTSSAASQHIADLQHQVTLKSLSLQTLQSEYTSLLQKSQRDRVKSQTFEKKTIAADQEINDVTTKNEDLIEQVRTLETQLEECERKRETERSDAVREKDQWSRMLEMSGRLQAKSADDRQKMVHEKESLQQRLLIYENEATLSAKRSTPQSHKASQPAGQNIAIAELNRQAGEESKEVATRISELQQDNEIWQKRTYLLRSVLERMEEQSAAFMEKRRKLMAQEMVSIPDAIQVALREDSAFARPINRRSDETRFGQRDDAQITGRRRSIGLPLPPGKDKSLMTPNTASPSGEMTEKECIPSLAPTNSDRITNTASRILTTESGESSEPKTTTRPKLQSVPLPKWQPPNRPVIRTEHLNNNQRRPSGPATPFPKLEPPQRQATEAMPANIKSSGDKSVPPPQGVLPAFGVEKTPARNYSPQYAPPTTGAEASDRQPLAVAMPPPPRPGPDSSSAPSIAASWRPS